MATFLFRINGGEVTGASTSAAGFGDITAFFDTIDNPTLPDGIDLRVPKIKVGTTVRNATDREITSFRTDVIADRNSEDKQTAQDFIDVEIVWRKTLRALVLVLIEEINALRTLHELPDRTLSQVVKEIKLKISNEDVI